jgi:hypothetical protein
MSRLTKDRCGCHRYENGDLAITCERHTPGSCWNCDWPAGAGRSECFHCGARLTVRAR